jgi:hypothetical protein
MPETSQTNILHFRHVKIIKIGQVAIKNVGIERDSTTKQNLETQRNFFSFLYTTVTLWEKI